MASPLAALSASQLASQGRFGDTALLHVNPDELSDLSRITGRPLTINPTTGLPEAFGLRDILKIAGPVVGGMVGSGVGAEFGSATAGLMAGSALGSLATGGGTSGAISSGLMAGLGAALFGAPAQSSTKSAADYAMGNLDEQSFPDSVPSFGSRLSRGFDAGLSNLTSPASWKAAAPAVLAGIANTSLLSSKPQTPASPNIPTLGSGRSLSPMSSTGSYPTALSTPMVPQGTAATGEKLYFANNYAPAYKFYAEGGSVDRDVDRSDIDNDRASSGSGDMSGGDDDFYSESNIRARDDYARVLEAAEASGMDWGKYLEQDALSPSQRSAALDMGLYNDVGFMQDPELWAEQAWANTPSTAVNTALALGAGPLSMIAQGLKYAGLMPDIGKTFQDALRGNLSPEERQNALDKQIANELYGNPEGRDSTYQQVPGPGVNLAQAVAANPFSAYQMNSLGSGLKFDKGGKVPSYMEDYTRDPTVPEPQPFRSPYEYDPFGSDYTINPLLVPEPPAKLDSFESGLSELNALRYQELLNSGMSKPKARDLLRKEMNRKPVRKAAGGRAQLEHQLYGGPLNLLEGGYADGPTDGQADEVPAKLSHGEYVIDAATVALLGGGNNEAGAKKLDKMRHEIRKRTTGSKKQPKPLKGSPLSMMS